MLKTKCTPKLPVENFLCTHSLLELTKQFALRCGKHPSLPLHVLNYDQIASPRDSEIVSSCRGIVIDVSAPTQPAIVAKGIDRFFHLFEVEGNKLEDFPSEIVVEEKVDGTYILLFTYNGQWICSTRHNFCEDTLPLCVADATGKLKPSPTQRVSYLQLLERVVGPLQEFGQCLDADVTYCIELCAPENRVVTLYDTSRAYLLAAMQRSNGWEELTPEKLAATCERSKEKLLRPFRQTVSCARGLADIQALLSEMLRAQPTFEGFVLRSVDSASGQERRMKLKSEHYLQLHRLKYRGWVRARPELIVPILLRGEEHELLAALRVYKPPAEYALFEAVIQRYQSAMTAELAKLSFLCEGILVCRSRAEYADWLSSRTKAACQMLVWKAWQAARPHDNTDQIDKVTAARALQDVWAASGKLICSAVFHDALPQAEVHNHHPTKVCPIVLEDFLEYDGRASRKPEQPEADSSAWSVWCECGVPMNLERLKTDRVIPRRCFCGQALQSVLSYKVGFLLWCCSDEMCPLTHEAHQRDGPRGRRGQPLGIPGSGALKDLRLACHDLMSELQHSKRWTKDHTYDWLAQQMGVSKDRIRANCTFKSAQLKLFPVANDEVGFSLAHSEVCPCKFLSSRMVGALPPVRVGVAVLITRPNGAVLLTRRAPHMRTFPSSWVVPGGHIEAGETLEQAGTREVFEETGLKLSAEALQTFFLYESVFPPFLHDGPPSAHHAVIYLKASVRLEAVTLQASEADCYVWLSREKVQELLTDSISEVSAISPTGTSVPLQLMDIRNNLTYGTKLLLAEWLQTHQAQPAKF